MQIVLILRLHNVGMLDEHKREMEGKEINYPFHRVVVVS